MIEHEPRRRVGLVVKGKGDGCDKNITGKSRHVILFFGHPSFLLSASAFHLEGEARVEAAELTEDDGGVGLVSQRVPDLGESVHQGVLRRLPGLPHVLDLVVQLLLRRLGLLPHLGLLRLTKEGS